MGGRENNRRLLTDRERYLCIVRWLNTTYAAYLHNLPINDEVYPCRGCPQWEYCPCHTGKKIEDIGLGEVLPIPMNWHILEQFTGHGSVAGHFFQSLEELPSDFINDKILSLHKEETSDEFLS